VVNFEDEGEFNDWHLYHMQVHLQIEDALGLT
jgi:hypothetical protein